jgi:hypothetical protein
VESHIGFPPLPITTLQTMLEGQSDAFPFSHAGKLPENLPEPRHRIRHGCPG